jgi:hypothetical protein
MGARVFLSANRDLVLGVITRVSGNETAATWDQMNNVTCSTISQFRTLGVDITDQDKGCLTAYSRMDPTETKVMLFDGMHRQKVLEKKAGAKRLQLVKWFFQAREATCEAELTQVKNNMPPETGEVLDKVPDWLQYPAGTPDYPGHGMTESSYVEAFNKLMKPIRRQRFDVSLKSIVAFAVEQRQKHEQKAASTRNRLPPRVFAHCKAESEEVHKVISVCFSDATEFNATVTEIAANNSTRCVTVNLLEVASASSTACSAGCVYHSGLPCRHIMKACKVRQVVDQYGTDFYNFMNKKDTTEGWKDQYSGDEAQMFSDKDIELRAHLFDKDLRICPQFYTKKGRR